MKARSIIEAESPKDFLRRNKALRRTPDFKIGDWVQVLDGSGCKGVVRSVKFDQVYVELVRFDGQRNVFTERWMDRALVHKLASLTTQQEAESPKQWIRRAAPDMAAARCAAGRQRFDQVLQYLKRSRPWAITAIEGPPDNVWHLYVTFANGEKFRFGPFNYDQIIDPEVSDSVHNQHNWHMFHYSELAPVDDFTKDFLPV